jgi:hypothetical protein
LQHDPAFGVPLVSNTCVDHWTFAEAVPPEYVQVEYSISTVIALEYDGIRFDIVEWLAGCVVVIASVLKRFADRFPPIDFPDIERPLGRVGKRLAEPW